MPNLNANEALNKNSVTYILGQLTQQVKDLSDRIDKLTDGTYKRITDLEQTKADKQLVENLQRKVNEDVEGRLRKVEDVIIPKDMQTNLETTVTILKVTLTLYGIFLVGIAALLIYHLFHSPIS